MRGAIRSRRVASYGAICLVAVAGALVLQPVGCNQTAHLALVKSLYDGSPRIDRYAGETCDTAYIDGHYYAAKAPGLGLLTEPWYAGLRLVGLTVDAAPSGARFPRAMLDLPRTATWQVSLWGATLAALALLLLVRWAADRLVPGCGTAAAVLLGLGTLVLPFSTLFFAHVLSATLGTAAFCLLLHHRRAGGRTEIVVAAGVVAGMAVVVELPLGILAVALALYAGRSRLVPYALGVLGGVAPLLVFNAWAFGNPFDLSYENAVIAPGESGHDVIGANDEGFFGVTFPSLRSAAELLASDKGLLVLTPLTLAGLGGLVALRRGAARREAILALAVCGAFLAYNSAYFLPFGGWVPGPRFLIPILPFLAIGIAAAIRAAPLTTAALAAPSILAMVGATLAEPLAEPGRGVGLWLERWRESDFTETIVTELGGGSGFLAVLPALAAIGLALPLAALTLPPMELRRRDAGLALGAVFLWVVVAAAGPELLELDRAVGQSTGLAAVVGLLGLAGATWLVLWRFGPRAAGGAVLLGILAVPGVASHSKWAILVVIGSGAILAATTLWPEART